MTKVFLESVPSGELKPTILQRLRWRFLRATGRTVLLVWMDESLLGVFRTRESAQARFDDAVKRRERLGETWAPVAGHGGTCWRTEYVRRLEIEEREVE